MPMPLKWTNEAIQKDALKYHTRTIWSKKSCRAYKHALRRKIIDQCCSHMTPLHETWTDEKIKDCAKKYKFRSDWWKCDKKSYDAAILHNILEDCSKHMEYKKNPYVDKLGIVYAYIFDDNSAYIGLTISPEVRYKNHLLRGPVFNKIKSGFSFQYKILEKDISIEHLSNSEISFIEEFKNKGYNLINKRSGGSLGTMGNKISLKDIKNSALKYNYRNEWRKSDLKYYQAAARRKILKEVCMHMFFKHKKWTEENIINEYKKYNNLSEWNTKSYNSYRAAYRNKSLFCKLKEKFNKSL